MARVKRSMMKNKRRNKILKLAKGFRNARSTKYKQAKQGVIRAGQHAFQHRRKKKRVMRKGWQIKIGHAVKNLSGVSYSRFIDMMTKKNIAVDRKIMADMIENDMNAFARFVATVTETEVAVPERIQQAIDARDADNAQDTPVKVTKKPAKTVEKTEETTVSNESDDLTKVEGIGPKIAETLSAAGVTTFAQLAEKTAEEIQEIITDVRGSHDSTTWPKQATMAAAGQWDELQAWQDEMDGGKED